jgi:hypothetical protein
LQDSDLKAQHRHHLLELCLPFGNLPEVKYVNELDLSVPTHRTWVCPTPPTRDTSFRIGISFSPAATMMELGASWLVIIHRASTVADELAHFINITHAVHYACIMYNPIHLIVGMKEGIEADLWWK